MGLRNVVFDFSLFLGVAKETERGQEREGVGGGDQERGVCLGNSIFYGVLRMGIPAAKFAPQVVKFCCCSVSVEDCVSEMQGDELECLL